MIANNSGFSGLTNEQVVESRKKNGANKLNYKKENSFWTALKNLIKEPMIILLVVTSAVYFVIGDAGDGAFMSAAIILVAAISLYQDSKSRNAMEELRNFSQPLSKVIRNSINESIKSEEIVIGDCLVVEEGNSIAADATIIQSHDFTVNESILTGESLPGYKDNSAANSALFQGTTVASGSAIATVTAIGNATQLGKIGKSIDDIKEEPTPLELQISNFVKKMVFIGIAVFVTVWAINFAHTKVFLDSLLKALTLAMSILPEEIPIAFTTFMALGAWRLMKMGVLVKQMKTVETLGSATVICTDKTGTITENKMSLAKTFVLASGDISDIEKNPPADQYELIRYAMWASEPIPFDPMEQALHSAYTVVTKEDERPSFTLSNEYPLEGKPPMMTHVFTSSNGTRIIAAKGAPEAIMSVSDLSIDERKKVEKAIDILAADGYRLLGVSESQFKGDALPEKQQEIKFRFCGLVAFSDPPKKNIPEVLSQFYTAGIAVKIVTGDNAATTNAIAKQIGFHGYEKSITGDELMKLTDDELKEKVEGTNVFTRMFPEAKLKIINALKSRSEIVAMTGDGVNDGPALKAAHIGIAMGTKGTEIARQAASLILLDDDLSKMVDAVAMGRRIYANLKKAIQYIISIHIPIILTVFIPLALQWIYPNIFSPVHIIFLELIMGPTCSIIYENEPMEENTMTQKPRPFTQTFFNWKELTTSVMQGLAISLGTLATYRYAVAQGYDEAATRTMVFTVLIAANILLTLVNRSFYYSIFTTLTYKNKLVALITSATALLTAMLLYITPLSHFFGFERLAVKNILISVAIGFASVAWFELVKTSKRWAADHAKLK